MAPPAAAAALVDQAPQHGKQLGQPLHLIEDHQLVGMAAEIQLGVAQPGSVAWRFQIEIETQLISGDLFREGRFAHLPGAQQSYGGKLIQPLAHQGELLPLQHGLPPFALFILAFQERGSRFTMIFLQV